MNALEKMWESISNFFSEPEAGTKDSQQLWPPKQRETQKVQKLKENTAPVKRNKKSDKKSKKAKGRKKA